MKTAAAALFYPKLNDVRWNLLVFLFSFVIYALMSPAFTRTPTQFIVASGTCVLLDAFILYLKKVPIFPLSGFVTSMGVLLLCDSPTVWAYFVVAVISILSKHLLRIEKRHIFNPNNFGIVLAVLFLGDYVTVTAGRWGGSGLGAALVACLGVMVVYRAKRLALTLSFVLTFLAGALLRAELTHRPFDMIIAPMRGAGFQLFIFYMITDPVTSPKSRRDQILFGVLAGSIDCWFRYGQSKYAPFFALFILCGVYAFIESVTNRERDYPWSLGQLKLAKES